MWCKLFFGLFYQIDNYSQENYTHKKKRAAQKEEFELGIPILAALNMIPKESWLSSQ